MTKPTTKDLPKLQVSMPLDMVWTVYVRQGHLMARLHLRHNFEQALFEGEIHEPHVILPVIERFVRGT